jgi:hypothetical protein
VSALSHPVAGPRRAIRVKRWAVHGIPALCAAATATLLAAPRLSQTTPSLIDDWYGVRYGGDAFKALVHGQFGSSGLEFRGRYRPAFAAVWNYAQWHLLGDPSVATAAAWNALRIFAFLVAVSIVAVWIVRQQNAPRALVWLPALLIATTPSIALDLVRFGPSEPLMLTGLILGIAVMAWSTRSLLENERRARTTAVALVSLLAGYALYLLGVYAKETSAAVVAFVPFAVLWLWPRVRNARLTDSRRTKVAAAILAVAVVAPPAHVALRLATSTNNLHYPVQSYTAAARFYSAVVSPFAGAPSALGTWLWIFAVPLAIWAPLEAARRRDRTAWLYAGLLTTGFLMTSMSLLRGPAPSRYYMPWIVAVAVVSIHGLARARLALVLAASLAIAASGAVATARTVDSWTVSEHQGATAVAIAKGALRAGCPLYFDGFDLERRVAVPLLLSFAHPEDVPRCGSANEANVLHWGATTRPPSTGTRCESSWKRILVDDGLTLFRCSRFNGAYVPDQNTASGSSQITFVRVRASSQAPLPDSLFENSYQRR